MLVGIARTLMENNIAADRAGTIQDVKVEAGQSVGSGDVVVVIG